MNLLIRRAILGEGPRDIHVRDGVITRITGAGDRAGDRGPGEGGAPATEPGAPASVPMREIDASGLHAFPSFRNSHTHVAMVLFRGYGDDLPLMEWLQTRIWPAEGRLTEEDVYHGARLGILEMIQGGTTFLNEMYWHRPALVRAAEEMGVRALIGSALIDLGDPAVLAAQKAEILELVAERNRPSHERMARSRSGDRTAAQSGLGDGPPARSGSRDGPAARSGSRHGPAARSGSGDGPPARSGAGTGPAARSGSGHGPAARSERVSLSLAPHSIYTLPFQELEWVGAMSAEHDLPVHIHLSETAGEVEDCLRVYGCRPAQLLERAGLLTQRLVAVHGQFLDQEELELCGEAGAALVMNPAANLKLATGGLFPYRAAREAGVPVCLGTDGAASNNSLDMLEEMKFAALLQKHREQDATVLPAGEALAAATETPAQVFGHGSGRLEVGEPADLVLVDLSTPATQPLHDPVSALVYAANASQVQTTICGGRVLMEGRRVEVCDPAEVVARAQEVVRARM